MKALHFALIAAPMLATACTGPINSQTTAEMPTGYLCRILDSSEYISTPSEQRAIYAELEKRGAECIDSTRKVIIQGG